MRSQIRFFLSETDERRFVNAIVTEPHTFLVEGPPWESSAIPVVQPQRLADAGFYLLIWNKVEVPRLRAKPRGNVWELSNEQATVQWIRSRFWEEGILTEGRIAIATEDEHLQRRYRRLRKFLQQMCNNEVICWVHPGAPTTANNPSAPDRCVWVGPDALCWLQSSPRHKLKQDRKAIVEAKVFKTCSAEPDRPCD